MIEKPTPQQARAIGLLGPNLIVSAAAGSGKTAVLVDRAIHMLQSGTDAENLLMLTFTNAAAAQMRSRIASELISFCATHDNARLRAQAELLETADICTIDAFCLKLVRRYFHLVDVDPLFSIASPKEKAVLCEQALCDLMDACFDACEEPFMQTLEFLADNSEDSLKRLLLQIYEYAQTAADPEAWLSHAVALYQGKDETLEFLNGEIATFGPKLRRAASLCQSASAYIEEHRGPGKPVAMSGALLACAKSLFDLSESYPVSGYLQTLSGVSLPAKNARNARMDTAVFAPVAYAIDEVKSICKELLENPVAAFGPEAAGRSLCRMAAPMRELQRLLLQFKSLYAARKEEQNALDFADVEHLALRILEIEPVRKALQDQYACVFVDEYQDINDLQESLITRLARPGSLFCVGDVKQSIYAFRHAEPALFLKRYRASCEDGPGSLDQSDVRLDLNTNFRSSKTILGFVNDVFVRTMRADHGGVDYAHGHALCPGLEEQGSAISVSILRKPDRADSETAPDAAFKSPAARQAAAAAQRIRQLQEQRFFDGKVWRNYRFSDIAILLRRLKGIGPEFVTTLMELGIPVTSQVASSVLSAQESGAMLSLLQVVDNQRDDLAMLSALRSPAAMLSASDLARIRAHDKTLPFALAAKSFAKNGTGASAARVADFFRRIDRYRELSMRVRVDELLSHIFRDTNALAYYALQPGGDQKVENLQALWLSAEAFSRFSDGSLYGFLQMLSLHGELGVSEVATAPGGSDSVRVMTIHGAKGLEFPAVILPFLHQPFEHSPGERKMTRELGVGIPCYDADTQTRQKSAVQYAIERQRAKVDRDEQLRLLYVALTRARHNLSLVAECDPSDFPEMARLAPGQASCFFEWIFPTLWDHPDCGALCGDCGVSCPSDYHIGITMLDTGDLVGPPIGQIPEAHVDQYSDLSYVDHRLQYRSVQQEGSGKISVSQLNAHTAMPFEPLSLPSDNGEVLDAAGVGTAVHKAMLKLDFADASGIGRIDSQLDGMLEKGLLTDTERKAVRPEILLSFLQTDLGKRLCASSRVLREQPFVLKIPSILSDPNAKIGAETVLQGIIDCAFWENDGWVLLDYKTNRMPQGGLEALRSLYQIQIDAYRAALETLTGAPVRQCALCLLTLGVTLDIAPGELYRHIARPVDSAAE